MTDDIEETAEETPTSEPADETATSDSPAEDASSSADSGADDTEEAELTPEQKAEREKEERKQARIKTAEAEEKRKEEARAKKRREFEESEKEERLRAREQQANDTLRRAQSLIDELEQRKQQVLRGGVDGLKALGIDYTDWTKKTLEEEAPDAVGRKALSRVEQLEQQLAEERKKNEQTHAEKQREASARAFAGFVDENSEDFPHAANLGPRSFRALTDDAAKEYFEEHGHWPSFKALLPRLDRKAKEEQEEMTKRSAKRARSTEPSNGASTTQATSNGQPARPPAHRTLDPATATTKAKAPRQLTADEEEEMLLEELRKAMRADAEAAKAAE